MVADDGKRVNDLSPFSTLLPTEARPKSEKEEFSKKIEKSSPEF
jgi:hypothetical protein